MQTSDLAEAFKPSTYNVMIVAEKFQTGFDQPRLVAMYVDKKLGGVQAVQTLSRLNRTYPGKDKTFVLDFVNEPEEVLEAFLPYYRKATLTATTDPNLIYDLVTKLDSRRDLHDGARSSRRSTPPSPAARTRTRRCRPRRRRRWTGSRSGGLPRCSTTTRPSRTSCSCSSRMRASS